MATFELGILFLEARLCSIIKCRHCTVIEDVPSNEEHDQDDAELSKVGQYWSVRHRHSMWPSAREEDHFETRDEAEGDSDDRHRDHACTNERQSHKYPVQNSPSETEQGRSKAI